MSLNFSATRFLRITEEPVRMQRKEVSASTGQMPHFRVLCFIVEIPQAAARLIGVSSVRWSSAAHLSQINSPTS